MTPDEERLAELIKSIEKSVVERFGRLQREIQAQFDELRRRFDAQDATMDEIDAELAKCVVVWEQRR